jgi:hypothetical protein
MPAPILQFKRGNAGVAGTVPALRPGEPAISLNNFDFFVGIDTSVSNNKFFGSHRYWKREDGTNSLELKLVSNNGSESVNLRAPTGLGATVTYTLPGTINDGYFLKTNSSGVLSWDEVSSNINIAADSGTSDSVSTGSTITFTGGTNINTAVTDNTITVNLDNQIAVTNLNVSGIVTVGTGVGITQFSSAIGSGTSTSSVPTSSAVITYVAEQIVGIDTDDDLGIAGDSGTGTIDLDTQSLTIAGTASEIVTSASGQTITVGLPDTVNITTLLDVPTVEASNLKAKDGTTAITITDITGAVATASDLTVGGNLYVNGSTTQVNTTALTVEDRTIDLGIVNGAAPAAATTWDLGVLFNYYTDAAKKSAVIWEHSDTRFKFASVLSADTDGTDANTPQLTVTTFAPIEIGSLWVTDCSGTSQVISCTGTTRYLENITIDAGTF